MAKPVLSRARWGRTAGDVDSSLLVEPASGLKDTGWAGGQRPAAQHFNWILNQAYKWFQWLDPLLTAAGGFLAATNADVTVAGTGRFKHGTLTRKIHWSAGWTDPQNGSTSVSNCWTADVDGSQVKASAGGVAQPWFVPIVLNAGERIQAVRARVHGHTSQTITLEVYRTVGDGTATQIGTTQTSATTSTNQTLAITGLTETVGTGTTSYVAKIEPTDAITSLTFMHLEVDYDRP